jgi:1,4-dihydroxy-2-naphthoyl-CoA hydrolase
MSATFKFKPTPEEFNERFSGTLGESLGIRIIEVGDDFIKASMPVDHRTKQPIGLLHGGASAALAETLGSLGSTLFIDQLNTYPVGLEINANHLKSVSSGLVIGTAKPVRIGRTVHVWNIEIHNEMQELICVSRLTVMLITK